MGFFLDLVANLLASWLDSLLTPYGMTGIAIAIAVTVAFVLYWHRQQRAAKKPGMASWQFIVLCFVAMILAAAAGGYGLGLMVSADRAKQPASSVDAKTDIVTGPTTPPTTPQGPNLNTHITLQFGHGTALPVATVLENIWRWYALANVVVLKRLDGGPSTEIKTWTVFLTLDHPINPQQVIVTSPTALPPYEVKDRDSRSIVIAFTGDLVDLPVEIKVEGKVTTQASAATPVLGVPVAATSETTKPKKYYSTEDKEKLSSLYGQLSELLIANGGDGGGDGVYSKLAAFGNEWNTQRDSFFRSGGAQLDINALQTKFQAAHDSTIEMYKALYGDGGITRKKEFSIYRDELDLALQDQSKKKIEEIQLLLNGVGQIMTALSRPAVQSDRGSIEAILMATQQTVTDFQNGVARFQRWEFEATQRAEKSRNDL
jgi:hypothetical protein